jgi:hypothetical protein
MLAGLLLSNMSLGAVTTFGGVNATICLGGLLSAAGGNELRSSICWLLPSDAGGGGDELPSSTCWSVCLSAAAVGLSAAPQKSELYRVA